jgi:hypothetical protein
MKRKAPRKQRSKFIKIFLAPIIAAGFLVGWGLYYIGESRYNKKQKPINKIPQKQQEITIGVIPKEELTVTA